MKGDSSAVTGGSMKVDGSAVTGDPSDDTDVGVPVVGIKWYENTRGSAAKHERAWPLVLCQTCPCAAGARAMLRCAARAMLRCAAGVMLRCAAGVMLRCAAGAMLPSSGLVTALHSS